jgi:uncharacterized protein (DUF2336 family)
MQPLRSFVREVEGAIASGEEARRVEVLRQVTTLFIEQAPHLGESHVGVFDEVIQRLASEIEFRARVELSERLAGIDNAPRATVRHLAFDENVDVAGPVLERSTRLDDADLVSVAEQRGQGHLLVLSSRKNLPTAVTDVIVTRGDDQVVQTVARNQTARFSQFGFETLTVRAEADDKLRSILYSREDVSGETLVKILEAARRKAERDLADSVDMDADVLASALDAGTQNLGRGGSLALADFSRAAAEIERLAGAGSLSEQDIAALIEAGRLPEAITAIARLAQMPVDVISKAYSAPHYDPILFVLRGIKFGWPTFKLLLMVKAGKNPPAPLLRSAFASFENLSVATAQRVMRFVAAKDRVARG